MSERRFDALAVYGAFLPLWRASAFDLPMAWAASFDIVVTEALRNQAVFWAKLTHRASPAELAAAQSRYTAATLGTLAREAKSFTKDVNLALKPAARGRRRRELKTLSGYPGTAAGQGVQQNDGSISRRESPRGRHRPP